MGFSFGEIAVKPSEKLNKMHWRASKIIFKYGLLTPSCELINSSKWNTLYWNYKYKLANFAHQDMFSEGNTNKLLKQRNSIYSFRGSNKFILPRSRTVTYRASTLWNNRLSAVLTHLKSWWRNNWILQLFHQTVEKTTNLYIFSQFTIVSYLIGSHIWWFYIV